MTARGLANLLSLLVLCVAVYLVTSSLRKSATTPARKGFSFESGETLTVEKTPDGKPALRDERGVLVPIQPYKRIVAGSITSTEILHELIEDDRIVAYSAYANPGGAWKYDHKPRVEQIQDVERILSLNPDIVFYNGPIPAEPLARLRENNVQTFDLGRMLGLESYLHEANIILTLLGNADRFYPYNYDVTRRARSVQCRTIDVPARAMYVGIIASTLFGGTTHTSYGDVLRVAGVEDAAAEAFDGWPQYSTEDILALDPPWIVTPQGDGKTLCDYGSLGNLQACAEGRAGIVEVPGDLLGGAGTSIIQSAAIVHDQIYGPCEPAHFDAATPATP